MLWEVLTLATAAMWVAVSFTSIFAGDEAVQARVQGVLLGLGVVAVMSAFPLSERLSGEWITGEVVSVWTGENRKVSLSLEKTPELSVDRAVRVLSEYEVAIREPGSSTLTILGNSNSLVWLKFNRREIQLPLVPGKSYRFFVYGILGTPSILRMQEVAESPPTAEPERQ